jgi:hypothetical protein
VCREWVAAKGRSVIAPDSFEGVNMDSPEDRYNGDMIGVCKDQKATRYYTMTFAEFDELIGMSRQVESNDTYNSDEAFGKYLIKWVLPFALGLILGYYI